MQRRFALVATGIAAVLGVLVGAYMLFGPTYSGCEIHMSAPLPGQLATQSPPFCYEKSLVEVQPVWPMPLLAIIAWSLAPSLAFLGVHRHLAGHTSGRAMIAVALLVEATVIISFGAAPLYVPFVLLPLILAVVLALRTPAMG